MGTTVSEALPAAMPGTAWRVALDCVAAAVLVVPSVGHAAGQQPWLGAPSWLAVVTSAVAALAVAVRRLRPVPVFAVALAANTISTLLGASGNPAVPVALVAYTVAVSQPAIRSLPLVAGGLGLTLAAASTLATQGRHPEADVLFNLLAATAGLTAAAWTAGLAVRGHREHTARAATELAHRAVAEERLRIARELHDIVSHSMTLMTAKAGVTGYLLPTRPQEAGPALAMIEETGRHALAEMRRMLGVLRGDGPDPADPDGDRTPAPDISGLPRLAARATAAGVTTELEIRGEGDLPPAVAQSVYRIVQEALTNAVKHAAPARCHVLVHHAGDQVTIDVRDDGRARPAAAEAGHGLVGMRERARLYGGDLAAGPLPRGGYQVTAHIPLEPVAGQGRPA